MGRSTLLGQIADEFLEKRDWFGALLTPAQVREALGKIQRQNTSGVRSLVRWLGARAAESESGYATLLIDDYDCSLGDEHRALMNELLAQQPRLRVITVSVDLPEMSAVLVQSQSCDMVAFGSEQLLFTREEAQALVAAAAHQHPGVEAFKDPTVFHRLTEVTRGVPGAVGMALDSFNRSDEHHEHQLAESMNQFITDSMRVRMRATRDLSLSAMYSKMSLMPRFTFLHVAACFPGARMNALDALAELPTLDASRRLRAGDHAWSKEFLYAARQFNAARVAERRELAAEFYRQCFAAEAFEQWFLIGDLARAEAMLRTRFLTVYETLSPETASEVSAMAPSLLAPYPMIRVMQALLDPRPVARELRTCLDNLGLLGARAGVAGVLALAVRSAVLARKGLIRLAFEQAEDVLRLVSDQLDHDAELTDAEQRTHAEAALIAALALLETGTIPSTLAVLPHTHGSPFLQYRREKVQQLLDQLRAEPGGSSSQLTVAVPDGYRSLVFSGIDCRAEIEAIDRHDRKFEHALQKFTSNKAATRSGTQGVDDNDEDALQVTRPVKYFALTQECVRLLGLGDQEGAVSLAFRNDVCEPHASVLQSLVLLLTGQTNEAREILERLGDQVDARTQAVGAVFRAVVLLRLGLDEPARHELFRVRALPATAVVQAIGVLRVEDAEALQRIDSYFIPFVLAAHEMGALGTGTRLAAQRRFQALTEKEHEVLRGLRGGLNTREIAERDFLSVNTVRTHVRSIGKKLDAHGQAEMLRRAEELRLFHV